MPTYFLALFTILFSFNVFAHEPKTLILIIATDNVPAYKELQTIWESYMNSDPEHFEAYFIRANPDLPKPYEIRKNTITYKTHESYAPGIINKTIGCMEALESRLDEFDFVIRTNLSSFYPFANLLKFLSGLPRENCYCGISLWTGEIWLPNLDTTHIPFVSGAGIIFSRDIVKLLLKEHRNYQRFKASLPDDVFIGLVCHKNSVPIKEAQRWDYPTYKHWLKSNHKIEDFAYHFRAKGNYNIRTDQDPFVDEILTLKALLKRYYSITL